MTQEQKNAGFWLRLLAMWLDLLIIYTAMKLFYFLMLISPFTLYFPFEFTLLMVLFVYSIVLIYWKGYTIGKWLLNMRVVSSTNNKLSVIKVLLRETVLKLLSALLLFMGFFWIGFSKKKKGWHDYIIKSNVTKTENHKALAMISKYVGIAMFAVLFGNYLYGLYDVYHRSEKLKLTRKIDFPYMTRNANDVTEISNLPAANDSIFEMWLKENGKSPEAYVIEIASKHQLTILGEMHEIKDNLDFFNKIIPALYYKSGVRCIAMECMPRTMNGKIEKLINAENFDANLAITIARSQPWGIWGSKEYWDVLETVWKLNKSIPDNSQKMRLVGIDEDWEGPYLAYFSIGNGELGKVPLMEKLKAPFLIDDLLKGGLRDELMACNIEDEIIKKNLKGLVWIGSYHISTNYAMPIVENGKIITSKPRMGVMLKQKYGNQVFSAVLYHDMKSGDTSYFNPFIERIMDKSGLNGCAFNLENSPFAMIRDSCSDFFEYYPTIVFQDIFDGFIYLKPLKQLKRCSWTKDYISKDMFMKYKPFYESKLKFDLKDADQMNALMSKYY